MVKKNLIPIIFLIFLFGILVVSAIEPSYCCERLKNNGPFCQNAPLNECDPDYKAVPTSCEATSYCKLGCCNILNEGECAQNTPLATCGNSTDSGVNFIADNPSCDVDQCKLGCCLMGDQAAFVTQIKCNKLSAIYGLEINFRSDITNELECLTTGTALIKGACVFEKDFTRTCKMMNQQECKEMEANEENKNVKFYQDHLCSDPDLGTECGPSEKTTCVEGKDEVYFVDTCGNPANIYDADRIKDMSYWKEIVKKEDACVFYGLEAPSEGGSTNSISCGNCNYVEGSVCKEYTRVDFKKDNAAPTYGDYKCKNLNCEYDNNGDGEPEQYLHGESWCVHSVNIDVYAINEEGLSEKPTKQKNNLGTLPIIIENGFVRGMDIDYNNQAWIRDKKAQPDVEPSTKDANLPGSRYFRMVCFNGEVTVEPCADFRQEVCIESMTVNDQTKEKIPKDRETWAGVSGISNAYPFDGYRNAACRTNRWQDCAQQKTEVDCINIEKRDCKWYHVAAEGNKCLPLYTPGLKFWGDDTSEGGVTTSGNTGQSASSEVSDDASTICSVASSSCEITYQTGNIGDKGNDWNPFNNFHWSRKIQDKETVKSGFDCYEDTWNNAVEEFSRSLGDCGEKKNYLGYPGSSKSDIDKGKLSKWN